MPVNHRKSNKSAKKITERHDQEGDHQKKPSSSDSPQDPLPKFQFVKSFARRLFFIGLAVAATYFMSKKDDYVVFVKSTEVVSRRGHQVPCSDDYVEESNTWKECIPKRCGRVVMDDLIPVSEIDKLLSIAQRGFTLGESDGGASILDLHSGALSKGQEFINIYKLPDGKKLFTVDDFQVYRRVRNAIQHRVMMDFGVTPNKVYLTSPTFFSRMTSKPAKTIHDEYWHPHVDKETYQTFHYTSLLYLGTYGEDFTGGRFVFVDKDANRTVEPRKGRLLLFTSGSENLHHVEKVTSGERYAITVSFTCNEASKIADPTERSS